MHFFIWYILAKLSTWFSFLLGSRYNDFKNEFYLLYHLGYVDDFERKWKLMVERFGLSSICFVSFEGVGVCVLRSSLFGKIKWSLRFRQR